MPWAGYEEAGKNYIPEETELLFIAEAPPATRERYFYFPDVRKHDYLWIGLMKALYGCEFRDTGYERSRKHSWLTRFKNDGYRLIDAVKDPMPRVSESEKRLLIGSQLDDLVKEVRSISPRQIVLIKVTVYEALFESLREMELPVVDARLPFPGSRRQPQFQEQFKQLVDEKRLHLSHKPVQ